MSRLKPGNWVRIINSHGKTDGQGYVLASPDFPKETDNRNFYLSCNIKVLVLERGELDFPVPVITWHPVKKIRKLSKKWSFVMTLKHGMPESRLIQPQKKS